MCFAEVAEQIQSRSTLQISATDINGAAIEKARRGTYIENITADVSPERLARFFIRTGKEFHVNRALRNVCNFSRHDMLADPAFSRMNLVSYRNVLIYLDSMQEKALSLFHFALNPGGLLLRAPPGHELSGATLPWALTTILHSRRETGDRATARPAPANIRVIAKTYRRIKPEFRGTYIGGIVRRNRHTSSNALRICQCRNKRPHSCRF